MYYAKIMSMESTLKNMILVLLTITTVAAVAVGGVYWLTKKPIEIAGQAKVNDAIAQVMPNFDNQPAQERMMVSVGGGDSLVVYPAMLGGKVQGYAIETFSKNGFGGDLRLMVGIMANGQISSIAVIEQKETPGLGDKIEPSKSDFGVQFQGKNPKDFKLAVRKDGGDVDAITASTITSRAYVDAVLRAVTVFDALTAASLDSASYSGEIEVDGASGATSTSSATTAVSTTSAKTTSGTSATEK